MPDGELHFRKGPTFDGLDLPEPPEIRRLSAEQSNSSQIISDALVLKIIRKVLAGVHPEGEVTGYLTEQGFTNTAPLFGEVVRVDSDGTPHTLMLLQGFVRNQGDGWGWTLDYLARVTDDIGMVDVAESNAALNEHYEGYLPFATAIGRRLAELHDVLSAPSDNADFAPRVAGAADLEGWATGAIAQVAFRRAYDEVLAASPHPWVSPEAERALLDLFLIEKAAYEIRYEASNRPTWLPIPLRGLDDIANRLLDGSV